LENNKKHDLKTYSRYESPDPIYSTALYPHFQLGSPTSTLVLYAARDTPIQLRNALDFDQGIYATYTWSDPNTEAVITPRSLVFTSHASHFVAGAAKAQFAIYDVNRPSSEPAYHRRTSKSRYAMKQYGADPGSCATGPNSIITTMDLNSTDDILALGTNTRNIALYADHGLGDLITSFKLPQPDVDTAYGTRGITQVKWSPDGTYLFVAERQSDTIEVYDVRQSCRRLSWLSGRKATVNFQMAFHVASTLHGLEVWAGGIDGYARMWSNPEQQEGEVQHSDQWHVHDGMLLKQKL
jgi:WD40 repeat protein